MAKSTNMYGKSAGIWNPGAGQGIDPAKANKLMNTEAVDLDDNLNATNDLQPYEGGSGVPAAPFGLQGKQF